MRLIYCLLFATASVIYPYKVSAQVQYPKTLLWRISGNGLQKPSYLYGTIHLQDKRLFYFTDSLYSGIESTDGFAIELDPDEMMDSVLDRMSNNDDKSPLMKDMLDTKQFKKIAKQLEKKYKIPADKLTMKRVLAERKHRLYYQSKNNMPSIVDMYLFNIARKQGKWTGGIEDVHDQMSLVDEAGAAITPDELANYNDDSAMLYIEQMKEIYITQDLNAIDSLFNNNRNKNSVHALQINRRNIKMARRIDSISALRTCFFAIGCAHLPGDSGVIALLRNKGFIVEPVLSTNKIAPEKYTPPVNKEREWVKVEDDNNAYSIEMPGKPSDVNTNPGILLKMYVDLSDVSVYGSGVFADGSDSSIDKSVKKIMQSYRSKGYDLLDKTPVELQGAKGMDLTIKEESKGYYLVRVLQYQNKLFMVMVGGREKETLTSSNAVRFLQSFIINKDTVAYSAQWRTFSDSVGAYSILVPGKANAKPSIKSYDDGALSKVFTYPDLKEGCYYITIMKEIGPSYYTQSDSGTFNEYKATLENEGATSVDTSWITFKGFPACRYTAVINKSGTNVNLEALQLIRGSRTYFAVAVTPIEKKNSTAVNNFFDSFTLLPFTTGGWKQQEDTNGYSIYAPDRFTHEEDTTTENTIIQKFYYKDKNSAEGFVVEKVPISKFYWVQDDSLFWERKKQYVSNDEDTLIAFSHFKKQDCIGADFLVNLTTAGLKKKMRYIITGDTSYCVYAYLTNELLKDKNSNKLFDEFAISKLSPLKIFTSKAKRLIDSLSSNNSIERGDANAAIEDADFSKEDLPLLEAAMLKDYPKDSSAYKTTNQKIQYKIIAANDSSTISFVNRQYASLPDNDLPMLLLEILARQQTTQSYTVLKKLIFERSPHIKTPYALTKSLTDSLKLSKIFFPEAGKLFSDSLLGPCFARLANILIDSNELSVTVINDYSDNLLKLAKQQYGHIEADDDNGIYTDDIIELMGKYNIPEGNDLLQQFMLKKNMFYKEKAILALLKNNQQVSQSEINKVAGDTSDRVEFYTGIKGIKKDNLFPAAFKSQEKFAESYLYNGFLDDDNALIDKMSFVTEKIIDTNGVKKRYFLFKMINDNDGEKFPRLGVCGPFSIDVTDIDPGYQAVQTWEDTDEVFSIKNINNQFEKFLSDTKTTQ